MSAELVPYNDIEKMGKAVAESGLFGLKTSQQAIALMLVAQALGKHPALAAMESENTTQTSSKAVLQRRQKLSKQIFKQQVVKSNGILLQMRRLRLRSVILQVVLFVLIGLWTELKKPVLLIKKAQCILNTLVRCSRLV